MPFSRKPIKGHPFQLHTKWSVLRLGEILTQLDEKNQESMVANASQPNNQVEATCSSFEGECLAIVWAMATFQCNLFNNPFTLVIYHQPLKWFMEFD